MYGLAWHLPGWRGLQVGGSIRRRALKIGSLSGRVVASLRGWRRTHLAVERMCRSVVRGGGPDIQRPGLAWWVLSVAGRWL
jgi:hypothetical protein